MIGGAGEERSNELWSLMLQAVNEHKKISKQEVEVWRRREREEGERMEEENSARWTGREMKGGGRRSTCWEQVGGRSRASQRAIRSTALPRTGDACANKSRRLRL